MNSSLHIDSIYLVQHSPFGKAVWLFVLDSCCENIISQIYQDRDEHFISRYKELAEVAARIRGACYGRFMRNPIFTRAYLINKICYCIYGTEYPYDKDDIFVEWLNKI